MRNFWYLVKNVDFAEEIFRQYRAEKCSRAEQLLRKLERGLKWGKL